MSGNTNTVRWFLTHCKQQRLVAGVRADVMTLVRPVIAGELDRKYQGGFPKDGEQAAAQVLSAGPLGDVVFIPVEVTVGVEG